MQFHFAGGFCKCKNVEADLWWFYVVSFVSTHSFAAFLCDFSSALHSESPTGQIIWKRRFWITWRQNCWLEQLRPSEVVGCSAATATAGGRRLEWRLRDSSSSRTQAPSPGFVPSPPQHKIPLSSSWSKNACHQYTHTHTLCIFMLFWLYFVHMLPAPRLIEESPRKRPWNSCLAAQPLFWFDKRNVPCWQTSSSMHCPWLGTVGQCAAWPEYWSVEIWNKMCMLWPRCPSATSAFFSVCVV